MHCETRTIVCRDCRVLRDVPVRVRVPETAGKPAGRALPVKPNLMPPMLLVSQPPRTKWLEFKPACPVSATHEVELWTRPGKCPKCETYLEQDGMPYRIWD